MKKHYRTWRETDAGQAREAGRYERPIPSRHFLLATLDDLAAPTDGATLARALGIKDAALRRALDKRLEAMVRDGPLLRNRHGQYLITDRTGLVAGTVVGHRDGFGFLTPDDGGEDLFAHFSAINMQGFKTLKEGQKVSFEVTQGPKGKQASNIQSV